MGSSTSLNIENVFVVSICMVIGKTCIQEQQHLSFQYSTFMHCKSRRKGQSRLRSLLLSPHGGEKAKQGEFIQSDYIRGSNIQIAFQLSSSSNKLAKQLKQKYLGKTSNPFQALEARYHQVYFIYSNIGCYCWIICSHKEVYLSQQQQNEMGNFCHWCSYHCAGIDANHSKDWPHLNCRSHRVTPMHTCLHY